MNFSVNWPDNFNSYNAKEKNSSALLSNLENIPPQNLNKTQSQSQPKKLALQPKSTKPAGHSIRAGDWVCLLCNNLNFSFRNECNRCQKQTKKQNYIQNLILISEEPNQCSVQNERKPFADLTNLQIDTNKRREYHWVENTNNHGFENVLLLTPPRPFGKDLNTKKGSFFAPYQNFPYNSPGSETNKKINKPYNSPQEIPSISPILKSDFLKGISKNEDPCAKNLTEFLCEKIYEDSREDEVINEDSNNEPFDKIFTNLIDEESKLSNSFLNINHSFMGNNPQNILNSLMGFMGNPNCMNLTSNSVKEVKGKKKNKGKIVGNENEKKSDWYCQHCNNLNYSFRVVCNRCQVMKPILK